MVSAQQADMITRVFTPDFNPVTEQFYIVSCPDLIFDCNIRWQNMLLI